MAVLPPDEWRQVRQVFEDALRLPAEERQRFVAEACPEQRIADRVATLIDAHVRAERFLETPAMSLYGRRQERDDLSGTRLGPYDIEARIGSGGMGDVYRARDSRLGRIVAIKVLPASATGDELARQQFEREAQAVAALKHPHICTLHDIGTAQTDSGEAQVHYLVMEHLEGETLAHMLARGRLTTAAALEYSTQIASALHVAHAAGVVHRDLKPGNIMVTASGATLLDFGVAKTAVPAVPLTDSVAPARSGHSAMFGTPCYMAPEQLSGEAVDARTDVFAFGCVLYEMLTGTRLFPDASVAGDPALRSTAEQQGRLDASIPEDLQRIVSRCLVRDPAGRYQTAVALLEDLQRATRVETSSGGRSISRRRYAVVAGATALVLIAAGVWTFDTRTPPANAPSSAQLAVLPLRVIGNVSPGDEHLGLAIADSIITRLAVVRRIGLRPTTAVTRYADAQTDPMQVARELAVDHLLTGTIQRSPAAYRVTFQLVTLPDGAVTWGRTYDMVRTGLRDVQDSVAEQVVDAIRLELDPDERDALRRGDTEIRDAYEHYLRGRASLLNYTEAGMQAAIAAFEQALALDPGYARARAGLALAAAWFSIRYAYESDAFHWGARAESEARAAVAADPRLAEARLAIAAAAGTLHGAFNWGAVIDEASRALELDPTLELAYVVRMRAYFHFGLFDRMVAESVAARRLNPLGNVEVARLEVAASLFSGQYERARDQAAALLARSDAPVIRNYLGLAQFYSGDVSGARRTLAAVERGGRPDVRSQAALASIEAAAGDHAAALARATRIEHGPYMDHHVAYSLSATHAQLGDALAAIDWLRQAADTGFPCLPSIERDPLLNPIRRHPDFVAFLALLRQRVDRDTVGFTPHK